MIRTGYLRWEIEVDDTARGRSLAREVVFRAGQLPDRAGEERRAS